MQSPWPCRWSYLWVHVDYSVIRHWEAEAHLVCRRAGWPGHLYDVSKLWICAATRLVTTNSRNLPTSPCPFDRVVKVENWIGEMGEESRSLTFTFTCWGIEYSAWSRKLRHPGIDPLQIGMKGWPRIIRHKLGVATRKLPNWEQLQDFRLCHKTAHYEANLIIWVALIDVQKKLFKAVRSLHMFAECLHRLGDSIFVGMAHQLMKP